MGANAQTSVPAFTTGQVLTAQQQTQINTGVPVFATTTTRDAAFNGTGEKTLAQGQLCYLESTNVVQYYNGTAWATLAPATAGALVFITSVTVGSGVSTVTVSNAFSATYDNYLILVNGVDASAQSARARIQIGAATTAYFGSAPYWGSGGTNGDNKSVNATSLDIGYWGTNADSSISMTVYGPNLAVHTNVSGFMSGSDVVTTETVHSAFGGVLEDTTQHTSITFLPSTGTLTGGTIRVYGYANS
jgi:hypothetical protein